MPIKKETEYHSIKVVPMGKPRMTQRDKWKQRPCVMRYREFKDAVREAMEKDGVRMTNGNSTILFLIPMPKSWSNKKKAEMHNQPHTAKPDIDNLQKALFDSMMEDDSGIWRLGGVTKRWCYQGEEEIRIINHF